MLIKSNEEVTPVECVSDMQYSYTPHGSGETFISHTVYSCVRPSVGYDSSLRGANTIQYVSSTASIAFSVI